MSTNSSRLLYQTRAPFPFSSLLGLVECLQYICQFPCSRSSQVARASGQSRMEVRIFHVVSKDALLIRSPFRWLFLVEGLLTFVVGFTTFFRMPPSPSQTKSWFRPKGWFTEREEFIATTRILRDDPTKGDMHNREALSPKRLWTAVCDYDLWPLYAMSAFVFLAVSFMCSNFFPFQRVDLQYPGFPSWHLPHPCPASAQILDDPNQFAGHSITDRQYPLYDGPCIAIGTGE